MTCRKEVGGCGYEFCWICLDEWKKHGLKEGVQFATLTDIIYKTWAGKTAKEYKLDVNPDTIKDYAKYKYGEDIKNAFDTDSYMPHFKDHIRYVDLAERYYDTGDYDEIISEVDDSDIIKQMKRYKNPKDPKKYLDKKINEYAKRLFSAAKAKGYQVHRAPFEEFARFKYSKDHFKLRDNTSAIEGFS